MAFLNTEDGYIKDGFGWLTDRIKTRLEELNGWSQVGQEVYGGLNVRCVEYHRQMAPGPGIGDVDHYDMGSVATIDVCLSSLEDFTGTTWRINKPHLENKQNLTNTKPKPNSNSIIKQP